jgi:hypothetical protein
MKKYSILKKSLTAVLLMLMMLPAFTSCDKDQFADINTNPSTISKGNVPYLFTQAILNFEPSDYLMWFYDGKYTSNFAQAFVPGSYGDKFNIYGESGGAGSQFVSVLNVKRDVDNLVSQMDETTAAHYQNIQAMLSTMSIYLGILDTDMYGSRPYSEACLNRYGGTLTPKYDTQEELFTEWIEELDKDIAALSGNLADQITLGNNDLVYGGDKAKWLKFANGVKLKIAVRLLHQNKTKALQYASEVGASAANVMSGSDDDFIYNKGTAADHGDYTYHFGNSVSLGTASKNVLDFMMKNKDPRLLVMFTKNDFNSEVIQAFFDAQYKAKTEGKTILTAIPKYVLDNVEYTEDANGKKTFKAWKGMGEPWVRYVGLPVGMQISDKTEYLGDNNYFNSEKWKVTLGDKTKTYSPLSYFNEELVRGRVDFTYPTAPNGDTKQDTKDCPWYGMAMSTAEMNLYLAEMKLLGATLPSTAAEYFNIAIKASAQEYNTLAQKNQIPYCDDDHINDPNEKSIKYGDTEIAAMMANTDYQLTGTTADQLEKVYIQQFLHFMYQPFDQFVTVRRSGIPKVGSALIPWVTLTASTNIPRRLYVAAPDETDKMYSILVKAYEDQGFSYGRDDPDKLNSERLWYDKGAPNFGEGPNF